MSKDETGSDEVRGLPGYPANNSIPSGFALPIPIASAPIHVDEAEPADPWSSTWEDTSWHISGETDETTNGAPAAVGVHGPETTHSPESSVTAEIDDAVSFAEAGHDEPVEQLSRWVYSDPVSGGAVS